jgi:hypothetical protein
MKTLYSILIVIVALFLFASLAIANPPFWDNQINNSTRFKVLNDFNNAAVYDKETGLVWEQSPDNTGNWLGALLLCYNKEVGARKGWRLPTIEELASLVNTSNSSPALPTGHPFTLTSAQEDGFYWSATSREVDTAFHLNFDFGVTPVSAKSNIFFVWCVRGGQGIHGPVQ